MQAVDLIRRWGLVGTVLLLVPLVSAGQGTVVMSGAYPLKAESVGVRALPDGQLVPNVRGGAAKLQVCVFTQHAQFTHAETDARERSVKDIVGKLNKKAFDVVPEGYPSDLTLEVLDRDRVLHFPPTTPGWAYAMVVVELKAGTYTHTFTGIGSGAFKHMSRAAGNVVDQFEHWVEANRAQLTR